MLGVNLVSGTAKVELMSSEKPVEQFANGERWLVESGFLGAVKDGRIEYEVGT